RLAAMRRPLAGCAPEEEPPEESRVKPGDRLPEFSVVMDDGSRLSTAELRGRESVIVLFNTDCPDCRRELPVIQALQDRNPGLMIACIAREEGAADIAAYWRANGLTLRYSPQTDRRVYNLFAESVIPRTYVADSTLRVVAMFAGEERMSVAELERILGRR
ncbi:MAG: TlpA family protein disulfide reductase, partial [Paramuribaculum sp.]|nr:TlpA family protein disulfide reductase [Paramuribaculum sp.]